MGEAAYWVLCQSEISRPLVEKIDVLLFSSWLHDLREIQMYESWEVGRIYSGHWQAEIHEVAENLLCMQGL